MKNNLTKRIIPCLDVTNGRVVKGVNFVNLVDAGDPVEVAKAYNASMADEIVFLDITASSDKRDTMLDVVEKTASQVFLPLTVGGGIRSIEDIRNTLNAGADKTSLNSSCIKNPDLINESSNRFGSQCIVVAIDAKYNSQRNSYDVYLNGGRTKTNLDAVQWAKEVEKRGAGEILLTSMDGDGTKKGYDLNLTKAVSTSVNIPVIASGGAGSMEDFYNVLKDDISDAALAASLFHFKEIEIINLKKYLKAKGIKVRL
ncbi:MAG: imidazole glycerol phosphate synthase subunit HisF [Lachnospirales bacterium]